MSDEGGRDVRVEYGRHDRRTDRPGVAIRTPFNADFVDDLKDTVPSSDRAWWPSALVWWVAEDYSDEAVALVLHYYGETIVVDEDGVEEYRNPDGSVSARQERLL